MSLFRPRALRGRPETRYSHLVADFDPDPAVAAVAAVARQARECARLVSRLRRRGVPVADAEDAVQIGLTRALSRSGQLRDSTRAAAWVARVVQNAVLDQIRARALPVTGPNVDELANAVDESIDCWCVLTQMRLLGDAHRDILQLVVVDGHSLEAAAAALGITRNAATVRLHRARSALRSQLATHCGTTSARSCSDCGCAHRGCCPPA